MAIFVNKVDWKEVAKKASKKFGREL